MEKRVPELRFPGFEGAWEEERLIQIATIERGKFSPRPRNNPIYYGGDIPFVQTGDVVNSNGLVDSYTQTLNKKGLLVSKLFSAGTILITIAANIGYTGIITMDMACPDSLIGIKCRKGINNVFLNTLFQMEQPRMDYLAEAAAQKNINIEFLKPYRFRIPPLPEQIRIATFLTAVDKRIALLQKKKEALEQYKKGVMQKLFTLDADGRPSLRFKDDNGQDYPPWEDKEIGEVFQVTRGNVLSINRVRQNEDLEFKYPVYSSQTKSKGLMGYYNEFLYENAITWTTDGANAGDVKFRSSKFYCTNVCGVLLNSDGYANQCIAEMLSRITYKYVSYVGNPKLMNGVMAKIRISFPSPLEQQKIASFLSSIDICIEKLGVQIDASKEWKKGLMQRMFV